MRKLYRYRSYEEKEREAMAEAERSVLAKHGLTPDRRSLFETQKEEYARQQTPAGQIERAAIDKMIDRMNKITKNRIQNSTLHPMYNYYTGEIEYFY